MIIKPKKNKLNPYYEIMGIPVKVTTTKGEQFICVLNGNEFTPTIDSEEDEFVDGVRRNQWGFDYKKILIPGEYINNSWTILDEFDIKQIETLD